jgi:urease accessory protein
MIIVEEIHPAGLRSIRRDWEIDTLTLPWEERCRSHGRRKTDQGREFALALPSGSILRQGDKLLLASEQCQVQVQEASESVLILTPQSPWDWAWLAYQIGNRHLPLMIADFELICVTDPAAEHLFQQLGVTYEVGERPFTPAIPQSGHTH